MRICNSDCSVDFGLSVWVDQSFSSWFVCWTHIIVNTILRLITKSKGPLQHHTWPRLLISRRFSSRLSVADARSGSMLWACCFLCMKPSTHRFIYVSCRFAALFHSVAVLSTKGAFLKAGADVHVEAPSCLKVFAGAFISSCQIFFFFVLWRPTGEIYTLKNALYWNDTWL